MEALLIREVKSDRMDANKYAMLVDNMRLKHGENQLYGSNGEFSRALMKQMPPTIDDIKNINATRVDIGLEPLKSGEY